MIRRQKPPADVVCFPPTSLPRILGSEDVAGEKNLQRRGDSTFLLSLSQNQPDIC